MLPSHNGGWELSSTVGEMIISRLRSHGVDTVFGIPGAHTIELYKHMPDYGIRHVAARHEQGAGYMADGYARASGRPGVCTLVAGPGLTNAASALGTAYADSSPVLVLSSVNAIPDLDMGRGHLHEVSRQSDISRPLASRSLVAFDASQVGEHLDLAFFTFGACRPRPVHIALPLDVLDCAISSESPKTTMPFRPSPHPDAVRQAAGMVDGARQVVIVAGGGAVHAAREIRRLAERISAPVVTSIAGKGILPDKHPLNLGATLQRAPVRTALRKADVILAIGTQLSPVDLELWPHSADEMERMLAHGEALLAERLGHTGKLVRIDLDAGSMTRDHAADAALLGDSRMAVQALLRLVKTTGPERRSSVGSWVSALRAAVTAGASDLERRHLTALRILRDALPGQGFLAADLCQIGYTANVFFPMSVPRRYFYPAGYGPLGFATPAAIGVQLARPDLRGAVLIGDYGFQFTMQELGTAVELELPLPIVIWNNEGLGEIKEWMRRKNSPAIGVEPQNPDFKQLAASYGAGYARPDSEAAFRAAIKSAHAHRGPTIVEIREDAPWLSA